jgi:hypothetical protein
MVQRGEELRVLGLLEHGDRTAGGAEQRGPGRAVLGACQEHQIIDVLERRRPALGGGIAGR